ncbi:site-2 protease family protein [uncultured Tateyamaria sp.]|uniref:site-2 protease family protein n=1 Tax=uncultured Tateyamaria sp. TaxID=455651 RepID=UPI002633C07A|nr:site-2 protease family protein [uncultured Tateyamaria sp.]
MTGLTFLKPEHLSGLSKINGALPRVVYADHKGTVAMFSNARTIITIFGFHIRVDPSWVLIAGLITWSLYQHTFPAVLPGLSSWTYATMALLGMLLFFASLVGHELAHAVTARRFGVDTRNITLFLFGGVAELAQEPARAMHEFWIALAGPLMSLALAAMFWTFAVLGAVLSGVGPVVEVLHYLALINLVLAIFNLLPAFPLDGGRILRAWLWRRSGDILAATETAAQSGTVLAYALMGLGLLGLFQGAVVAGFWQILIGLFVLAAARSSLDAQRTRTLLGPRDVRALMTTEVVTTEAGTSLAALVNQVMLPKRIGFVPVVEEGQLLGHIDTDVINGIDRENWANTTVDDVFVELDQAVCIPPDLPVLDLMERISRTGQRKFMVVAGSLLLGVVSLSDLTRYLGLLAMLGKGSNAAAPTQAWSEPS